jgi:5-methylcytosine-specific restriction endonuclease McrA
MTLLSTVRARELNNPEYRWYHKEEMSKIMPYPTERKKFGIKILDYDKLRNENDLKIILNKNRMFDWTRLKYIVESVPLDLDRSSTKKTFQPKDRLHFESKHRGVCWICGQVNHYGSNNKYSCYTYTGYSVSHLHHIIPNGDISDDNIITLCVHCHQLVHHLLYMTGRWRYGNPL